MTATRNTEFDERFAYSIADVAGRLGLSERTIHRMISTGAMRSIKAGRRRLIPREAVRQLLTGQAA
jgi:excisionase family DNA binding protein